MDDNGSVHMFEAVITAIVIMSAILFMTGLSKPTVSESIGGVDLGRIADDSLTLLAERPADCPHTSPPAGCTDTYGSRLEEILHVALEGDATAAESFMAEALPSGTRFQLSISNGVAAMPVSPLTSPDLLAPRHASAAARVYLPDWTAFAGQPIAETLAPGAQYDFSSVTTITAPNGETTAPGGISWRDWWAQWEAAEDTIPANILLGIWQLDATYIQIERGDGAQYPVYNIQLVVWPGA